MITKIKIKCKHCGEECTSGGEFCCEGCRMVYQLLDTNGLCNYYQLNERPGMNRRITVRPDKFAFLDDSKVEAGLVSFQDESETHVTFYLPAIHCSSCLYLLEHLHKLNEGVKSSRVDFAARQVSLVFETSRISLRGVAELLTSVGYEPHISLKDWGGKKAPAPRGLIYQLGVAGFCFANVMLISFPEYLGLDRSDFLVQRVFRYLNLLIALPVVFYSAQPFYRSAFSGLRHRFLNIDAPIVLAIFVTFGRSLWEVLSGTGSGYFDSLTGIVFFMLLGRVLQDRTYKSLAFDRDYTAYFPVAVTVVGEGVKMLGDIKPGDTIRVHSGELVPVDGILTRGRGRIDYSFVTGESVPIVKEMGELLYAGGKQEGGAIEVLVVKEVSQGYLTQLWNKQGREKTGDDFSFVHPLSRWFTYVVLSVALGAAVYWGLHDGSRIWNAVTAVLIVACPCALLLSSTFTNGNLLRILARNQFYLRNASVIERIGKANHIVFDKTGTLTEAGKQRVEYIGRALSVKERSAVVTLAGQSSHPLSRALVREMGVGADGRVVGFVEEPGAGIMGYVGGRLVKLGSKEFVTRSNDAGGGTRVYVAIDGYLMGYFEFVNYYRQGIVSLASRLRKNMGLAVLSGDNGREKERLQKMLGSGVTLLFGQSPVGKSRYIEYLQGIGRRVMMVGDGLNDAGALRQSDIGIALTEDCNNFTPASDAILRSDRLGRLPDFIRLCRAGKRIVLSSFVLSILYNMIGLSFAVGGVLSPMVAAILMPSSSLTILLVTYGSSSLAARRLGL